MGNGELISTHSREREARGRNEAKCQLVDGSREAGRGHLNTYQVTLRHAALGWG